MIYEFMPIYGKNMGYTISEMICGRCGEKYPIEDNYRSCLSCGGPLLLDNKLAFSGKITRNTFSNRVRGSGDIYSFYPKSIVKKLSRLGKVEQHY